MATEDVVYALESMGVRTGVDLSKILEVGEFITGVLGRQGQSKAAAAIRAKMNKKAANKPSDAKTKECV